MTYSLDQLAWFDRCLFPEDFKNSLIEVGASEHDAYAVFLFICNERRKGNKVGIIGLYQEFITDTELCSKFETVVANFFEKHLVAASNPTRLTKK